MGRRGLPARGPLRAASARAAAAWARALLELAVERARERGCRRIELDVNDNNDAALALYRSIGFDNRDDRYGGGNLFMRLHLEGTAMTSTRWPPGRVHEAARRAPVLRPRLGLEARARAARSSVAS